MQTQTQYKKQIH